ncbi:MAG: hypothetical protein IKI30_00230 [Oxalobacter sp.]|nr:hypothetical protein [Oxalobacter sp.]
MGGDEVKRFLLELSRSVCVLLVSMRRLCHGISGIAGVGSALCVSLSGLMVDAVLAVVLRPASEAFPLSGKSAVLGVFPAGWHLHPSCGGKTQCRRFWLAVDAVRRSA